MDVFARSLSCKVVEMPDFVSNGHFQDQNRHVRGVDENLVCDEDLFMEKILENINTTPIGLVLKKIASLPEVRKDKILHVRRQLTEGKYDLNERLNVVLDKVLEELTA